MKKIHGLFPKIEKIKTRQGKSVKLVELLDEARDRAYKEFKQRNNLEAIKKTEDLAKLVLKEMVKKR